MFTLLFDSGQAAQLIAITTLAQAGDNIISSTHVYGGTYNQFNVSLPRFGITTTFVDISDLAAIEKAINPKTKAMLVLWVTLCG